MNWLDEHARDLFARSTGSDLASLCSCEEGEVVSTARTRVTRRIEFGDEAFFLKTQVVRPLRLPIRRWPSYLCKGSPLVREVRAMPLLSALGLRVPELVAHGSSRSGLFPHRAAVLVRACDPYVDLVRHLAACAEPAARARACDLAEALVRAVHAQGHVLLGAKYRNLLVPPSGPKTARDFVLIDQPSFRKSRSERLRAKDLSHLAGDRARYGREA